MIVINPYELKRKVFLDPLKVIEEFGIKEGSVVLDFGSGSGFWTIPMAQKVGMKGLIIATDRSEENLSIIKNKAERLGLSNVKLLRAPYNSKIIPVDEKLDYIIISNILSLTGKTRELIAATKKNSLEGTHLLIVDTKKNSPFSVDPAFEVTEQEVVQAANEAGFEFERLIDAGSFHFALSFIYTGKKYEKND